MIYVVLDGRLGNNLFQIAAARSLSENVTLCFKDALQIKHFENYKNTLYKDYPVVDFIPKCKRYTDPFYNHQPIPYVEGEDLIIEGSFQSYKYFNEQIVRGLFPIDLQTKQIIDERYRELLQRPITCIHVRRGDYLQYPHRHPFCGKNYYMNAINYIGKEERFIVCSDDIAWCKRIFKGNNFFFVENSTPLIDFYIQTQCSSNIISNSSFSWWGAWLNPNPQKKVIAPSMWYGIDLKNLNTNDLLPSSYVILENRYSLLQYLHAICLSFKTYIANKIPVVRKIANKCIHRKDL